MATEKLRGERLRDEVKRLLTEEGLTAKETAKRLNVSIPTVFNRKRQLGLISHESDVDKWVETRPEVKRAFQTLTGSSRQHYYTYFKKYCEWIEAQEGRSINPADLWEEPWDISRDRIVDFRMYLEESGRATNTIQLYTTVIRRFYEYNNIIFKGKFFTNGHGKRNKEENEKELYTVDQLREIIDISDQMEKALYMIQFQSGLAANELCSLKVKHVADVDNGGNVALRIEDGVIKIKLTREKTNVKFVTFIGHDAIELLQKYLDLRQSGKLMLDRAIGERACITSKEDWLFVNYHRGTKRWGHISTGAYARYLRNRVRELGWISDEDLRAKGQLNVFRPHALRMSFSELLKHKAKISWDIVEVFLGHKFNDTDAAYVKYSDDDLRQAYKEGEPYISLTPIEAIVTDDQYKELKIENMAMKREIENLKTKAGAFDLNTVLGAIKEDRAVQDTIVELLAAKIIEKRRS